MPAKPKKKALSKTLTKHLTLAFHNKGLKKVTSASRIRWDNSYDHIKC